MTGAAISIQNLEVSIATTRILDRVDLEVSAGSLTCLLGPSGSGKSTLLACVAGLIDPDAGAIRFDGQDVRRVPPHRRPVTMVSQQPQLFPFLSVIDNVAFGLRARRVAGPARRRAASESLELVGLGADRLDPDRSVSGLSGGEAQRVSLARALCVRPQILLLDEPLASLDPPIRRTQQDLLADIHGRTDSTMVLVTHDRDEALSMADHLVVLDHGRIRAAGTPTELFERPPNRAAADLLGVENLLDGARFGLPGTTVAIRPEAVQIETSAGGEWTVRRCRYLGPTTEIVVARDEVDPTEIVAALATSAAPAVGTAVAVTFPSDLIVPLSD